jgi:hypothetical protein
MFCKVSSLTWRNRLAALLYVLTSKKMPLVTPNTGLPCSSSSSSSSKNSSNGKGLPTAQVVRGRRGLGGSGCQARQPKKHCRSAYLKPIPNVYCLIKPFGICVL